MPDPLLKREGNWRFAAISCAGYPPDPLALVAQARDLLGSDAHAYGPATLLFAVGPDDLPPDAWECQAGTAITGMARPTARLNVEDYRGLYALSLPHQGAIRDLGLTWRRLADHAKGLGHRLRPYWRLALRSRQLADGNLLPVADVAVFLDKP